MSIFKQLKKILPLYNMLKNKEDLKKWVTKFVPPGHYYSPYVEHSLIREHESSIFNRTVPNIPGVHLNTAAQLVLLQNFSKLYPLIEFPEQKSESHQYYFQNQYFSYSDAISLSCMMLYFKPLRIIEVGSGYSSAVMSDINRLHFNNRINIKFIEPYPEERLLKLIHDQNESGHLIRDFIQNVDLSLFEDLQENDLLFIDSSHVSKTYSDVNFILFEIIPRLKPGVIIHFHDIFYPFEYPKEWVLEDRAWNEAYLLRAFLQFNHSYEILLYTSYMEQLYKSWYENNMPNCLIHHMQWRDENGKTYLLPITGQSVYIRRII